MPFSLSTLKASLQGLRLVFGKAALRSAVGVFFASIAASAVEILGALLLTRFLQLLQTAHRENQATSLYRFSALLLAVGLVRWLATSLHSQLSQYAAESVIVRLRLLVGFKLLRSRSETPLSTARFTTLFHHTVFRAGSYCRSVVDMTTHSCIFAMILAAMCWVAWRETLLTAGLFLALSSLSIWLTHWLRNKVAQEAAAHADLSATNLKLIQNRALIRVYRREAIEYSNVQKQMVAVSNGSLRTSGILNLLANINPTIAVVTMTVTIFVSLRFFHSEPSSLLILIYLLVRSTNYLAGMHSAIANQGAQSVYFQEVLEVVEKTSPQDREEATREGSIRFLGSFVDLKKARVGDSALVELPTVSAPSLEIRALSFSYPRKNRLFSNITLTISPGQHLGIVGASGCGKTTLLHLICGLLEPESGSISIAGQDPDRYFLEKRGRIGYLGPEPMLFGGTLLQNLTYGFSIHQFSVSDCYEALRRVGLESLVRAHPKGLEATIGEMGATLSTGEKQRFALARILLMKPCLVVLDEPTANLDRASEGRVLHELKELGQTSTLVMVSHRPIFDSGTVCVLNLEQGQFFPASTEASRLASAQRL